MRLNLAARALSASEEFKQVGGTEAMAKGEPCLTIAQAEYLGQWKAFSRVLYEMGQPTWNGFDFDGEDRSCAEHV